MRRLLAVLAIALALVSWSLPARAQSTDAAAAARSAIAWMRSQQQPDGGFPGFSAGESADAIFALVAAGIDPNGVLQGGNSPVSYLGNQAAAYAAKSAGAAAKLTLAVVAAGKDPRGFGGLDLPSVIGKGYDARTGQYGADVTGHCLTLLAVLSMGTLPPPEAVMRLKTLQLADGGWSFDGTAATGSDTNTTALCVQGLMGLESGSPALTKARAYLKGQQNADGGFPYSKTSQFGSDSDANSTANVIQALTALGEDTGAAVKALMALQNPSGAFRYQAAAPDDSALATYQAVTGLLAQPLPVRVTLVPGVHEAIAPVSTPVTLPNTGSAPDATLALLALALALLAVGSYLRVKPRA